MKKTLAERLWARVDKSGGDDACWPWSGSRHRAGHGQIGVGGNRLAYAHRVAWELTNGPIAEGLCVCHKCDNPPCCNPAHMFLGTRAQNLDDMWNKRRGKKNLVSLRAGDETRRHNSAIGPDGVLMMFQMRANGMTREAIAESFGVRVTAVNSVLYRYSWKHVHVPEELIAQARETSRRAKAETGRRVGLLRGHAAAAFRPLISARS